MEIKHFNKIPEDNKGTIIESYLRKLNIFSDSQITNKIVIPFLKTFVRCLLLLKNNQEKHCKYIKFKTKFSF